MLTVKEGYVLTRLYKKSYFRQAPSNNTVRGFFYDYTTPWCIAQEGFETRVCSVVLKKVYVGAVQLEWHTGLQNQD